MRSTLDKVELPKIGKILYLALKLQDFLHFGPYVLLRFDLCQELVPTDPLHSNNNQNT